MTVPVLPGITAGKPELSSKNAKGFFIVANVITGIRIVCATVLAFCPTFSTWFYLLYIVGGASDVLDGTAARLLGKQTKFGSRFDTVADIVFALIALIKVIRAIYVPIPIIVWAACIAAIKFINIISGFVLYKRFVTEHTVMNKICGAALFAIPLFIARLPQQAVTVLMFLTCAVATFAAVNEWHYIRSGKEIG